MIDWRHLRRWLFRRGRAGVVEVDQDSSQQLTGGSQGHTVQGGRGHLKGHSQTMSELMNKTLFTTKIELQYAAKRWPVKNLFLRCHSFRKISSHGEINGAISETSWEWNFPLFSVSVLFWLLLMRSFSTGRKANCQQSGWTRGNILRPFLTKLTQFNFFLLKYHNSIENSQCQRKACIFLSLFQLF